jgi:hypothetical protein
VDQLTEQLKRLGLSESAARTAAVGRDNEVALRRRARAAGTPAEERRRATREAERKADLAELEDLGRQIKELAEVLRAPSTGRLLDGR